MGSGCWQQPGEACGVRLLAAAGSKRMKKAIRGNLMAMLAIRDGPAKLKQLMEAKMNAAAKAK